MATKFTPREEKTKKDRFASAKQVKQVYDMTRKVDPSVTWIMLGAVVGCMVLFALIGAVWGMAGYFAFIGFLVGITVATFLFSKRAEKAAYAQVEGQPGSSMAVISGLRRGTWAYDQTPVAMEGGRSGNPNEAAMVFRVVGLPGVILVGEGPAGRAEKLLAAESKRTARLIPNVPVTTYRVGTGNGDHVVSARELNDRIKKLPKVITKTEVSAVNKRLRSMTALRPPVPQGIDPNRVRSMGRGPRR